MKAVFFPLKLSKVHSNYSVEKAIPLEISIFVVTYIHVNLEIIIPLLGLVGFIGNLIIYLQSEFRSNTCCIYLLWSSFVDIISLYTNVFPYYLQDRFQIDPIWYW